MAFSTNRRTRCERPHINEESKATTYYARNNATHGLFVSKRGLLYSIGQQTFGYEIFYALPSHLLDTTIENIVSINFVSSVSVGIEKIVFCFFEKCN